MSDDAGIHTFSDARSKGFRKPDASAQ